MSTDDSLPTDLASAAGDDLAERAARMAAQSEAQHRALLIEKLKFTIRKLRHERFGQSSERGALLDQLELQLADLEEDAAQPKRRQQLAAASMAEKIAVPPFERRKPARRPLPEHLPRERIVYPAPAACPCCGGGRLRKLGEDVTETLELVPAPVEGDPARAREVLLPGLRGDHAAAGALAPDRARAGRPKTARPCPVRQIRPASAAQPPERRLCAGRHRSRRLDAGRLGRRGGGHADAAGRGDPAPMSLRPSASMPTTRPCRCWPRARPAPAGCGPTCATTGPLRALHPPAAVFFYSRDRGGEHPERHLASYAGLMQADAYAGFNRLYEPQPQAGADHRGGLLGARAAQVLRSGRINKAPIAVEAVERIDALFAIEREINGVTPQQRVARAQ